MIIYYSQTAYKKCLLSCDQARDDCALNSGDEEKCIELSENCHWECESEYGA